MFGPADPGNPREQKSQLTAVPIANLHRRYIYFVGHISHPSVRNSSRSLLSGTKATVKTLLHLLGFKMFIFPHMFTQIFDFDNLPGVQRVTSGPMLQRRHVLTNKLRGRTLTRAHLCTNANLKTSVALQFTLGQVALLMLWVPNLLPSSVWAAGIFNVKRPPSYVSLT